MENVVNEVLQSADQQMLEALEIDLRGNGTELKIRANLFLNNIVKIYERIRNINLIENSVARIKAQIKTENGDISILEQELSQYKREKLEKEEFNKFMNEVLNFQKDLNTFLGQQIKIIYVYSNKDGSNVKLFEIDNSADHLTQSFASKGGGLKARYKNLSQTTLNSIGTEYIKDQSLVAGLNRAYSETIWRARYGKKKRQSNNILLLWKPLGDWKEMWISSEGDINESYASFYLREDFINANNIETLLDKFLTSSPSGVLYVDNISGLLEGDVSVGNIEYAIKSKGASTLGYKQTIDLANIISSMNDQEITEEFLKGIKKQLHERGTTRNKILENTLNNDREKILDELKKEFEKRVDIDIKI